MFQRQTIWRIVTTSLVLIAIIGTEFAPVGVCAGTPACVANCTGDTPRTCAATPGHSAKSACGVDRPCCCQQSADTHVPIRACSCRHDDGSPARFPVVPNEPERCLKRVPWLAGQSVTFLAGVPTRTFPLLGRRFVSTCTRTLHVLLCVWRI